MANELTVRAFMAFMKGDTDEDMEVADMVTVTGSKCLKNKQTVGTSAEALEIGDMTTPGFCLFHNTDSTNYVEIRDGAEGADLIKLKAGEVAMCRLATATPYGIANTAAVELRYMMVEN
jgi:hypothetical protein